MQSLSLFLKKATIPFFVFATGACVLIIEIVAMRILSPYYGNTIFAVSSVISVVLGALSLGYYAGGKLADYKPNEKLFYAIITISGFLVIFLYLLGTIFLAVFGYTLSLTYGPLISSLILFFLQSFFLGMLSPFAVKLQTLRLEQIGVGSASGQIFFWSTLGSIAGSLLAGFYLIPAFGINTIMLGVGVLLIALGVAGGLALGVRKWWFLAIPILVITPFFVSSFLLSPPNAIYVKDGLYQKLAIYEKEYNGHRARFLFQDHNASAAEFLDSDALVYEYTKYYALYALFNPNPKNILCIGGGAYSVPKALLKVEPEAFIDVAEIEPGLFDLAKQYFGVSDSPHLTNIVKDGRRLLHDSSKKYDFIFSDAYASFFSTPEHLTTQEFFTLAKAKLSDNGVFIANVVGSLAEKPDSFALSEMRTFQSVFENSYFFAVNSPNSPEAQNLIFIGYNGSEKVAVSNNDIIKNLPSKAIDVSQLNLFSHPILTDNYAPVDYLISKEFENIY